VPATREVVRLECSESQTVDVAAFQVYSLEWKGEFQQSVHVPLIMRSLQLCMSHQQ
jgi:hypothetical protein